MKKNIAYDHMGTVSPPAQPIIDLKAQDYQQMLLDWNSLNIKKGALFYQFDTGEEGSCTIDLLPDGCMNILFKCNKEDPTVLISGLSMEKRALELESNTTYFGFKPYSINGIINTKNSIRELKDITIDIEDFFPKSQEITEKIVLSNNFSHRIDLFLNYTRENIIDTDYTPDLTEYLAILICNSMGKESIKYIVENTGYSDRYCRQKFRDAYGITLKDYSNIIRFQNSLKMLMGSDHETMVEIAYDNGYFDQAHFINDFRKFTGDTPSHFAEILSSSSKKQDGLVKMQCS